MKYLKMLHLTLPDVVLWGDCYQNSAKASGSNDVQQQSHNIKLSKDNRNVEVQLFFLTGDTQKVVVSSSHDCTSFSIQLVEVSWYEQFIKKYRFSYRT